MKKVLVFAALFFVIFSSGCTVPLLNIEIPFLPDIFGGMNVQEQRHDVISIERLDTIPSSTVRSGQSVNLRAVVKNLQSPEYKAVDNVEITLFNDCGMFTVSGDFCQDGFEKNNQYTCIIKKMHPQYTAVVQWKLVAKDINVETPCKVGILARYNYNTYSTTSVTFVNKAELERIVSEGKSFSETGTLSISEGPVKPYVEVLNQPIVIDTSRIGDIVNQGSGIMSFWLENKGGGYIDMQNSNAGNVDFVKAAVGKIFLDITSTPMSSGTTGTESIIAIDTNANQKIPIEECIKSHLKVDDKYGVNFIGKSTPKYSCSITVSQPDRIKEVLTYQIRTEIGYSYKFTKETTITVQPKIKL